MPFIIDLDELERIRDPECKRDAGRVLMEIGQEFIDQADRVDSLRSFLGKYRQEAVDA